MNLIQPPVWFFSSLLLSSGFPPEGQNRKGLLTAEASVVAPREHTDLQALSNEMVRLYKEQFGRGPTKAVSLFAGSNTVICTLENSLTPAERNLAALGEHQRLRDVRLFLQHVTEDRFVEAVERITGRTVRGFVSGMDTSRDISAEVFYLHPLKRRT